MKNLRRLALLALAPALLAGCARGDSPVDPIVEDEHIRFTFNGTTHTGSFEAQGEPRVDSNRNLQYGTMATGVTLTGVSEDAILVFGYQATGNNRGNGLGFYLSHAATGQFTVGQSCDRAVQQCARLQFSPSTPLSLTGSEQPESVYFATSAVVNVAEITATMMRGSFSGTLEAKNAQGQVVETTTVTNGSFQVAIRPSNFFGGSVSTFNPNSPAGEPGFVY
ncbi:MAG: hypothetical protein H0X65_05205, partial [Gemmatimonadetes bacterium]|nr:hypothetical protein [Gemmatimonadota bacterium]